VTKETAMRQQFKNTHNITRPIVKVDESCLMLSTIKMTERRPNAVTLNQSDKPE